MILVSHIRPFDAKQKIYVVSDNKQDIEEIRLASLEQFSDTIMQLITEYGISELDLHGNLDICEKEKEKIMSAEFAKYNNNQLKINIKGVI